MRDSVTQFLNNLEAKGKGRYGDAMEAFSKWAFTRHQNSLTPEEVAKTVLKALEARKPKPRYRLGLDSKASALFMKLLPDRWFDKAILGVAKLPMRFGVWRNK